MFKTSSLNQDYPCPIPTVDIPKVVYEGIDNRLIKQFWPELKRELMGCTRDFFLGEASTQYNIAMNHAFITLVHKKPFAALLGDFNPIFCANLTFKLLTKVILGRMMKEADEVVSLNETTLMSGRMI